MGTPQGPAQDAPALVERDRELAALRDALAAALAGHGSLVLIGGEAGLGKTTLAETTLAEAATQGALALVGRCYDLSETPPYGPWAEALDRAPTGDALPALPPAVLPPERDGAALTGTDAIQRRVRDYLAALAATRPLALLLEDLHWADPASLDLLRIIARGLAEVPLLLLATYRSDELTRRHPLYAQLPTLVREARATRLELHRLEEGDLRALVQGRYALPPADEARLVAYLLARAEGNPFYAGELLRSLADERILQWRDGGWRLGDPGAAHLPALLRQVLDARLDRLGAAGRDLLATAAVIGQAVPLALWAAVAGTDEDGLLDAIERGVAARLVVESPDGAAVRFAHALIREALYEGLLATRRRRLHLRLGETLAATPRPDPDAVAHHFQRAGDARAGAWLTVAGERAQRAYAWQTASARYEAALALLDTTGDTAGSRILLLRRLAQLSFLSAPQRGVALLEEAAGLAADLTHDGLAAAILCEMGMVRANVVRPGDLRRSKQELAAGVAALSTLPLEARRRLVLEAQVVGSADADFYAAVLVLRLGLTGHFAEALAAGERLGNDLAAAGNDKSGVTRGHVLSGLAAAYAAFGRPDEAREAGRASHAAYAAAGHQMQAVIAATRDLLWTALPYAADDLAARGHLADAVDDAAARASALDAGRAVSSGTTLPLLLLEGRWAEARQLALGQAASAVEGIRRAAAYALAPLARAQGDTELGRGIVWERLPAGPDTDEEDAYWFLSDLGLFRSAADLATDAGDPAEARAWLAAHDRWLDWSGAVQGRAEGQLGWAEYHRAAGDLARAREHAARALTQATEPRQPLALLAAHRLLGELDTAEGRHAEAAAHLAEALALADACAAPYERALTLLALAELRAAAGEAAEACTALEEARATLAPLEAAPALARADALVARLVAPPPATSAALPFGLTAREAEVLAVLAEGLTDQQIAARLFVSRNTVNTHTRAIYGKLGVTSRAAATRIAMHHGLR